MKNQAGGIEQVHARLLGDLRPGAERPQGPEITRPPVEIDDKDRSAEDLGPAQHPNSRVIPKIIEDQAALPLFSVIGDHGGKAGTAAAKRLNA